MPNDKWNDEEIENLLRDFPEIQDERPKAEVYKQLAQTKPAARQPKRWLPLLVAIVAFFSISVLVVSLLQQDGNDSSISEPATDESQSTMSTDQAETEKAAPGGDEPEYAVPPETDALRTAVYESDLAEGQLFRIGLAHQAYVVPVSFLIPNGQVPSASGSLALYDQFAEQIDETQLGFNEYHPFEGNFQQDAERLNHFLPNNHPYDEGSASTLLYLYSLEETFMDQQEIHILNEEGTAAEFSHLGVANPIIPGEQGKSFYVLASAQWQYLAPAYGLSEAQAKDALLALQNAPNDDYASPVPSQIGYAVEELGDALTVVFDEPLDLLALDEQEAMQMIESMALTAESYEVSLQFENIIQPEWGGFEFAGPIELPVAPNRIDWPQK
ncbi:hypothetical protein [Planococcus sp. ISL-109]|uniref:hypothetical protein n=1 Tax=Planococcus sp. ISL-109 TaxID=2819166 RepID=UPI001BE9C317|nr:hypothetical protein [Planococcus sp. ISL-109]MBT2582019.1 hypothetical protein [Planococcus sp. ISL-109]